MSRTYFPVSVPGNTTVHAGYQIGVYASGNPRYRKLCGASARTDRHEPGPAIGPVTCKRCLASHPFASASASKNHRAP